ncbi:hypothetical protein [Streptomyces violaceusniger]|uniref:Uncharacterized protein n=1 Tax=Streptomyces violaceusniger (strain Tu 4113) TaxID=653045 RepID=G2P765_STRV4|nr:hypothetical protein [Streptomyces violaceusniger]AEM86953.1 hypothetical protein Strvi_7612 [Streptomyces violaceusniger Tu 4113]
MRAADDGLRRDVLRASRGFVGARCAARRRSISSSVDGIGGTPWGNTRYSARRPTRPIVTRSTRPSPTSCVTTVMTCFSPTPAQAIIRSRPDRASLVWSSAESAIFMRTSFCVVLITSFGKYAATTIS